MKTKSKTSSYIVHSIAAAVLLLTAQISQAGSATWLSSPQDSAWENANNWTPGGPPNGPSDIATFAQSSQRDVNISTSKEVDRIVFTSNSNSFDVSISGAELIFSGRGVINNNGVLQTFVAGEAGQIIFNNTSTAGHTSIFNGGDLMGSVGGQTIFNDSSTAGSATLVASGGVYGSASGGIFFNGASTGGTARVKVFRGFPLNAGNGYLAISGHQSGVTVGSIEGDGYIVLGANDLTVGTNNINTVFSGFIGRQRFARQGRQWCTHFANQLLHRGHRRSHSGKRLNCQPRLYRGSGRNRIFSGRRRFATAGHIWRSNERRSAYPS